MQTAIADFIRDTDTGLEADGVLRKCVHCGFCNATCPTYRLLGDELDGPRGRIYLIKQVLEGHPPSRHTQLHLDRCLTCLACETTCPSGVRYRDLLDIGREQVDQQVGRSIWDGFKRSWLRRSIPHPERFARWLRLGQFLRPLLPHTLKGMIPKRQTANAWPTTAHARSLPASSLPGHLRVPVHRKMLVLDGCAQPTLAPNINAAAARVLDKLGISLIRAEGAGCCGALSHHTSGREEGLDFARRNIDAWWPPIEVGAEAIVMTASGCGVHVKEYGRLLRHDPAYADKAKRISELTKDLCEILAREDLSVLKVGIKPGTRIAFQSPCTLQHGQQLNGVVEEILSRLGFVLTAVPDAHLCCGSAGTYSLLQRDLAQQLLARKVEALQSGNPEMILTANIGCLAHLQTQSKIPVRHWVEMLGQ